jgi:energy-coupling factor transporter ATP-binding protein EcfA2
MSVLSFAGVSYTYPDASAPALRDVSLTLEPGEFCVLAGLSGSGKSTLLRAAAGLVPHFHGGSFAGHVNVAGLDTRDAGPAELGALAGTLLQDPETQIVMSTVRAELALAMESRGHGPAAVARAVEEVALALGIGELLERSTAELSGGELQRVALAAVLISRPPLVLLDEPTSQLDPVAGDELVWQLRRLNQESDTAVLLIEHRLERCLAAADRVIAMADGSVVCDRDPSGFLEWAAEHQPELRTPAARLIDELGLKPPPSGVKQARATLRRAGLLPPGADPTDESPPTASASGRGLLKRLAGSSKRAGEPALELRGVWHEISDGPAILRGIDLHVLAGEALVLMGRNGAGKSTLLRHAGRLLEPTRGSVQSSGRVALLLQNPGDYFLHERVEQEASAATLEQAGLTHLGSRHPRDLSGGQRQRLALAIVLAGEPAAVIALDEPTRGMDRGEKARLAGWLAARAGEGAAVLVATHDGEFAAEFATRAVLIAGGHVIADGPTADVLAGGWYFATETARILGGAGGALRPPDGVDVVRAYAGNTSEASRHPIASLTHAPAAAEPEL